MFNYLLVTVVTTSVLYLFIKIETPVIIYKQISTTYGKLNSLSNLVSLSHKGKIKNILICIVMILKALYISFLQYINNTVTKIDKNMFEIKYMVNGKVYKMIVKTKKGPSKVLQISNDKYEDLTDIVLPYLGPEYNCHGKELTPKFFKSNELYFEFINGESKTFSTDEHLLF